MYRAKTAPLRNPILDIADFRKIVIKINSLLSVREK
jgi:hypothetical protein